MAKESKKKNQMEKEEAVSFEYEQKDENVEVKKSPEEEKYDVLYNQFIRLQADFDNYKKRNASLASQMYNDGVNEAFSAILPTVDTLDIAIESQKDEATKKGLELVKKAFIDVLNKYEIEEIKALGEEFDPNYHEAVMSQDDKENVGKVIKILRAGYKRGDKILRHTMCIVGQ